jgi:hypothetical protein
MDRKVYSPLTSSPGTRESEVRWAMAPVAKHATAVHCTGILALLAST